MSLPTLSQLSRLFSRPPVTRQGAGQAADDPTRPQGPQPLTLDIDANDAEASAAAQQQRLFGPLPGVDRPLQSWEAAANMPDGLPRDARLEAMYSRLADIVRSPAYEY